MVMPQEELSRAVSSLDLNAALTASQNQPQSGRYTRGELLSLRPEEKDIEKHAEHVVVTDVGLDGVATPPSHMSPNPPPPTPETTINSPAIASSVDGDAQLIKPEEHAAVQVGEEPKKKKKKSSGKNKRAAATGFEEFYADPPITPDEHEEECDIYDSARPFHERIETCIQRYRSRRNLDSTRSNILTKYLMLGGIEATAKTFTGGLDKETIETSTAEEIRAIQATDYIRVGNKKYYDPTDSENWVVDFEGVAKGFFAYRVPQQFSTEKESDIKLYCSVIRNFLNYVLAHVVCPEYTLDVMAARRICDAAEKELWALKKIRWALPGDFNIAASTLHRGRYESVHISAQPWAKDDPNSEDFVAYQIGQSVPDAERIFKTAIAFAGNDKLFREVMKMDVHIVKTETKAYELVKIERASLQAIAEYSAVKNPKGEAGYIKALGVMTVKSWDGPGFDEEDFTDDEGDGVVPKTEEKVETFWLEDEILQLLYEGMKMELVVHELNVGIKFFDAVDGLYCSFHAVLPNEKMNGWKEPVPNTRPPPTEDDPDVEERAIEAAMQDDIEDVEKMTTEKK